MSIYACAKDNNGGEDLTATQFTRALAGKINAHYSEIIDLAQLPGGAAAGCTSGIALLTKMRRARVGIWYRITISEDPGRHDLKKFKTYLDAISDLTHLTEELIEPWEAAMKLRAGGGPGWHGSGSGKGSGSGSGSGKSLPGPDQFTGKDQERPDH